MNEAMTPYGLALLDFFNGDTTAKVVVQREDGLRSDMPVDVFFRLKNYGLSSGNNDDNTFSIKQIAIKIKNSPAFLPGIIILFGIALRLRQYLANRSLWRDEASLALNIMQRSFLGLTQPLDDNQGAPLLFLWLQKGIITIFGSSEYALRLLPLLCGIISLFVFWFIASKYVSKRAALFALTFLALSDLLIEFSSEVKQYSSDVLVCTLVLVMLFSLRKSQYQLKYTAIIGYGLLGTIFIWISHPAIFLLAAIGIASVYDCYSNYRHQLRFLIITGGLWCISFFIFYAISLTNLTNNQYLIDSWRAGFPPSSSHPLSVLQWSIFMFVGVFEYPGGLFSGLGAFLYGVGFLSMYHRDKIMLTSLILPLLLTLFAAFLSKYPFTNRFILFLLPLLLLLVAEGLDYILKLLSQSQIRLAAPILLVILFTPPAFAALGYLQKPILREEIKPTIQHVYDHWQTGDIIYIYYGAYFPFKYYQKQFGFQDNDYVLGIESRQQWVNYLADLNRLQNYKRVWLIFSHVHSGNGVNEEHLMVNWLDRTGAIQKDWFPQAGASVYLYEFN